MIRLYILHADVHACYTFCRCVTANGFVLTDRHTHTHRMLTVPEWLSIFPVQVKLPCNYLCQPFLRTVKILPFTFIEKGDSETIKYKTVPLKSGPSQLSSPETVTSKFQFDSHQYFICRYRQLQNTILGSRVQHWILLPSEPDVLLRLQTKEVQSPNLACRRLEGYRPVARRVLTRDDTNRRKNLSALEIEPTIPVFGRHNALHPYTARYSLLLMNCVSCLCLKCWNQIIYMSSPFISRCTVGRVTDNTNSYTPLYNQHVLFTCRCTFRMDILRLYLLRDFPRDGRIL